MPKDRLFELQPMVATDDVSCRVKLFETLSALAARTTDLFELTADTVAVN